jgi:hypothetical protein
MKQKTHMANVIGGVMGIILLGLILLGIWYIIAT